MALPLAKHQELSIPEIISRIEKGLPAAIFTSVRNDLEVTDKELARLIKVPKSTLASRKRRGRFSFEESERLYRLQRLFSQAVTVFGDAAAARRWLKEKAYGLGGVSPLEFAGTEIGAREVENLLGRIEHGVFS